MKTNFCFPLLFAVNKRQFAVDKRKFAVSVFFLQRTNRNCHLFAAYIHIYMPLFQMENGKWKTEAQAIF
jgi:hypothetical protein